MCCLVIENAVEAGAEAVNAAFGDHTELSCTPLRSYEGLAEHVLGVDKTLTEPSPHRLGNDGRLFWLNLSLEYRGKRFYSLTELFIVLWSSLKANLQMK